MVKKCRNIKLEKSPFFPTKKGEQTLPQNKNRSNFIAFCVCAQEKVIKKESLHKTTTPEDYFHEFLLYGSYQ